MGLLRKHNFHRTIADSALCECSGAFLTLAGCIAVSGALALLLPSAIWLPVVLFLLAAVLLSTRRKRTVHLTTRIQDDLLALFDRIQLCLLITDRNDHILHVNRFAARMLGVAPRSLRGKKLQSVVSLPGNDSTEGPLTDNLRTGGICLSDGELKTVTVEKVPLTLPGHPIHEVAPAEQPESALIVLTDLTEILQDYDASRVKRQNQVLGGMLEVFADGVRNPLAGISAQLQWLARLDAQGGREDEKEKRHEIYQTMVSEIAALDRLMEALMNQAHISPEDIRQRFEELKAERRIGREKSPSSTESISSESTK